MGSGLVTMAEAGSAPARKLIDKAAAVTPIGIFHMKPFSLCRIQSLTRFHFTRRAYSAASKFPAKRLQVDPRPSSPVKWFQLFRATGNIEPVDLFMVFIWKANRAKTRVRTSSRVRLMEASMRQLCRLQERYSRQPVESADLKFLSRIGSCGSQWRRPF